MFQSIRRPAGRRAGSGGSNAAVKLLTAMEFGKLYGLDMAKFSKRRVLSDPTTHEISIFESASSAVHVHTSPASAAKPPSTAARC